MLVRAPSRAEVRLSGPSPSKGPAPRSGLLRHEAGDAFGDAWGDAFGDATGDAFGDAAGVAAPLGAVVAIGAVVGVGVGSFFSFCPHAARSVALSASAANAVSPRRPHRRIP